MAQSADKCSASCSKGGVGCKKVSTAFTDSRIVPDVVDHAPEEILTIAYDHNICVEPGKDLKPAQVISQPKVSWVARSNNQLYTLVELDLDAPSATDHSLRSVLHWLAYDIPSNDVTRGREYAAYMGSAPFPDSEWSVDDSAAAVPTPDMSERLRFDMRSFIRQNNLGQPVAGNFYLAQADAYATEFWAKRNI